MKKDLNIHWGKYIVGITVLILAVCLYLDAINYFTSKALGASSVSWVPHLYNIHLYNWITFAGSIFAVIGTYIFTRMENKKYLKQQKQQFDEEKEIQKEENDRQCIFEMLSSNLIEKETILIVNPKRYEYTIKNEVYGSYCKKLNSAFENEKNEVLNEGLNKYYKMYNDIVLLESYMVSKKYKGLFKEIIDVRNKKPKKIKNPKEFIINNKKPHEKLFEQYRKEYLKVIDGVGNNGK